MDKELMHFRLDFITALRRFLFFSFFITSNSLLAVCTRNNCPQKRWKKKEEVGVKCSQNYQLICHLVELRQRLSFVPIKSEESTLAIIVRTSTCKCLVRTSVQVNTSIERKWISLELIAINWFPIYIVRLACPIYSWNLNVNQYTYNYIWVRRCIYHIFVKSIIDDDIQLLHSFAALRSKHCTLFSKTY